MAAAAAATVHPSPPPPPPARRIVARFACAHLAWVAADAVNCLFLASVWLLFWGLATAEIGRLACGEDCAVVTAAYKVVRAAVFTLVLVFPFGLLLLTLIQARAKEAAAAAATVTDIELTKEPVPSPTTCGAAMRDALRDPLTLLLLPTMAFALLVVIGALVEGDSPVTGSRRERMGSVISEVGALGTSAVDCLGFCPILTVRIWRAWRMVRHAL